MKLFRQPARGNWQSPLQQIARELKAMADSGGRSMGLHGFQNT